MEEVQENARQAAALRDSIVRSLGVWGCALMGDLMPLDVVPERAAGPGADGLVRLAVGGAGDGEPVGCWFVESWLNGLAGPQDAWAGVSSGGQGMDGVGEVGASPGSGGGQDAGG